MTYHTVHPVEEKTLKAQPDLGRSDVSRCLPGWIKSLCMAWEHGGGVTLSQPQLGAVLHTLIAARARNAWNMEEKQKLRDALEHMCMEPPDQGEEGW